MVLLYYLIQPFSFFASFALGVLGSAGGSRKDEKTVLVIRVDFSLLGLTSHHVHRFRCPFYTSCRCLDLFVGILVSHREDSRFMKLLELEMAFVTLRSFFMAYSRSLATSPFSQSVSTT